MDRRIFTIAASILFFTAIAHAQPVQDAVYFDFDRHEPDARGRKLLDSLLHPVRLGRNADSIVIHAHCDDRGSYRYNDRLSAKRFQWVRLYIKRLIRTNPQKPLITGRSFGKRQPVADNRTPESRRLNRRTEVWVYYTGSAGTATTTAPGANSLRERMSTAKPGGANIVLQNILFEGGRHVLLPSSYDELDTLLAVMLHNPALQIEIQGHICCEPGTGDGLDFDTQTYDLSAQRAKAVYHYLVKHGVTPGRMRYTGFGHQRPLTAERNEEERQQNRRVEIRVLKQ